MYTPPSQRRPAEGEPGWFGPSLVFGFLVMIFPFLITRLASPASHGPLGTSLSSTKYPILAMIEIQASAILSLATKP